VGTTISLIIRNIFFAFLLSICFSSFAQNARVRNLKAYDQKVLHFGFSVGFNMMDFNIHQSDNFFNLDTVYSVENTSSLGFNLGPIVNFRIATYFDVRALILLSFGQRDMHYRIANTDTAYYKEPFSTHDMILESTFIEFPLLLKYKAKRQSNYRPYLIAGFCPKYDLAAQKKIKEEEMPKIRLNQLDFYYEFGFGIDYYLEYFKLSTEIKFAVGLLNVLKYDGTEFTTSIRRMTSNQVTLSFHFE
jgi:hypothetical protein